MRLSSVLISIIVSATCSPGIAQIHIIKDIGTRPAPNPSSRPTDITRFGDSVYFVANGDKVGRELFRTQGTRTTTQIVHDTQPGRVGATPMGITPMGTTLFYSADDGTSGRELWKTNGTPATTTRVLDLRLGTAGSEPTDLTALGNMLLFTAIDASGSRRIFRSNGSASGTAKIHDGQAIGLHVAGNYVWFRGGATAADIWRTDGTASGTVQVFAAPGFSTLGAVFELGGKYYFGGCLGLLDAGLFVSDGTANGTSRLRTLPFRPYCVMNPPAIHGVHAGFLWLSVSTPAARELWKSDGTAAGTTLVRTVSVGSKFVQMGQTVFFTDGVGGLWKSDGTSAGTALVTNTKVSSSSLRVAGGRLWFAGLDAAGAEPWTSDGTNAGTIRVADIRTGPESSSPRSFVQAKSGDILFVAEDGVHGIEIWATNGTAVGTRLVADVNPAKATLGSSVYLLGKVANTVLFRAEDGLRGAELWRSNGTAAGTQIVVDLQPGPTGSYPWNPVELDGQLFFQAQAGGVDQLFVTDGTASGTKQLTTFANGVGSSRLVSHTRVYFTAIEAAGVGLWFIDSKSRTTSRLHTFATSGDWGLHLAPVGDQIFFVGYDAIHGYEPWKTDGSAAGTILIKDTYTGTSNVRPSEFTPWRGKLYFAGLASNGSQNLWVSDGTATGTFKLADVFSPREFAATQSLLFFVSMYSSQRHLFRTDGTAAGTHVVTTVVSRVSQPIAFGDKVLFPGFQSTTGTELWISDGTATGTRLVGEIQAGAWGDARALVSIGSRYAYFVGRTSTAGEELWVTDGTTSGTRLVQDLNPGPATAFYGNPRPTLIGGNVYLAADDGLTGIELYRFDPGATAQQLGRACGNSSATLWASDPVLGGSIQFVGGKAPTLAQGVLMLGFGPAVPIFDCLSYISLPFALLGITGTNWNMNIAIPPSPGSAGVLVIAQAWYLTSSAPHGFELSNALSLTLGL